MIETIPHQGGLGLKRLMARRMARRTGQMMYLAEDIHAARKLIERAGDSVPCSRDIEIEATEIADQCRTLLQERQ